MANRPYLRKKDGARLQYRGMNTVNPPDKMPPNKYPYAQNVRAYLRERVTGRATQGGAIFTYPNAVHSIRRLNDSTPAGPPGGYILVVGADNELYTNGILVDSGLSGNPVSLLPFRPNASVQPWMYVGDSTYGQMLKVRSDGTTYNMGIAEPQAVVTVSSVPASDQVALLGPVTVYVWGDSPHSGPVSAYIWKNANDPTGTGPIRNATPASVSTSGNSLLFDSTPGSGATPMAWTTYATNSGSVSTSGTAVTLVGGSDFSNLTGGEPIVINAVTYTISHVNSATSLTLGSSAGTQTDVTYSAAVISGTVPLFEPQLESAGYQDFNMVVLATLYIPKAGAYTFNLNSFNDCIWGIGSSPLGNASWSGPTGGQSISGFGQTKTVWNGYPLMPRTVNNSGNGDADTASILINFSQPGNYPIEIDYDYWYHTGRTLTIQCNSANIQPLPSAVITQAQYRYTYRSSATGATSNPSPESVVQPLSVLSNTITPAPSGDPQVDKIDFYRLDLGLTNFTYVGTGPNSATPFVDSLLDADVAANPILDFSNFQPFPSIDLPRSGTVNVSNGVATWVSGDQFNIRWLPGTIIIVGTVAYTLDKRPTSATTLTASNEVIIDGVPTVVPLQSGTGLVYEIAEPILAAQPLPHIWGPTDNVSFFFGCKDPLRPGTLYWSMGNNPDSAPDTNQQDVTSPSEPLMNGCITNGIGMVFSTERGFLIYPNFFNALATVSGTEGATWTLQESVSNRGLYMEWALAVDGGGNVFFRGKDGIYLSPGGQGARSITDEDIYNLFPHEGFAPTAIEVGGFIIRPPNDNIPEAQQLNVANGYLYYDYQDITGSLRTLVYDIIAGGWCVDVYGTPVAVHVLAEGAGVNQIYVGCVQTDSGTGQGTVRTLANGGNENATSVILMPCDDAGDVRAPKHWSDIYIEAEQ